MRRSCRTTLSCANPNCPDRMAAIWQGALNCQGEYFVICNKCYSLSCFVDDGIFELPLVTPYPLVHTDTLTPYGAKEKLIEHEREGHQERGKELFNAFVAHKTLAEQTYLHSRITPLQPASQLELQPAPQTTPQPAPQTTPLPAQANAPVSPTQLAHAASTAAQCCESAKVAANGSLVYESLDASVDESLDESFDDSDRAEEED